MESIKKKIASLKTELDNKDKEIDDLKSKLKQEEHMRECLEQDNRNLSYKLSVVECALDKAEEEHRTIAKSQLHQVKQERDDYDRRLKSLESTEQTASDSVESQMSELKEMRALAEESDRRYEEVARRLVMMEAELEKAEERQSQTNDKNRDLTEECKQLNILVKSYETSESQFTDKEAQQDKKISCLLL